MVGASCNRPMGQMLRTSLLACNESALASVSTLRPVNTSDAKVFKTLAPVDSTFLVSDSMEMPWDSVSLCCLLRLSCGMLYMETDLFNLDDDLLANDSLGGIPRCIKGGCAKGNADSD